MVFGCARASTGEGAEAAARAVASAVQAWPRYMTIRCWAGGRKRCLGIYLNESERLDGLTNCYFHCPAIKLLPDGSEEGRRSKIDDDLFFHSEIEKQVKAPDKPQMGGLDDAFSIEE